MPSLPLLLYSLSTCSARDQGISRSSGSCGFIDAWLLAVLLVLIGGGGGKGAHSGEVVGLTLTHRLLTSSMATAAGATGEKGLTAFWASQFGP